MKTTLPLALTFLTKVPWPWRGEADAASLARSLFWFPWVGALLGLLYCGAWALLGRGLPRPAAAALLLALTVALTGGLHLDGLADTVDGLGGGHTPEARLSIMKDSRVGTFGVLSLIVVLVLKFACFLSLKAPAGTLSLFLFPVLSRWGMVLLAYLSPYARPEGGLGQAMTSGVSGRVLAGATVSAGLLAAVILGVRGLILLTGAGLVVWLTSRYFRQMLGGITGDVLGATNELLEVLVLSGSLLFS
jgi:adenosylcobinamide-GDP ribazoletransferase